MTEGESVKDPPLFSFLIGMLKTLDQLIQNHSDSAQDNDRRNQHIELEEMEGANEMDRQHSVLRR